MKKKIDPDVVEAMNNLTSVYTSSKGKTKLGIWLRMILRIVPLGTLLDAVVHKNR